MSKVDKPTIEGVTFHINNNLWQARIKIKKELHLGYFKKAEDAEEARLKAEKRFSEVEEKLTELLLYIKGLKKL